ncbi:MAG: hypothetical protein M1832_002727 [Thelocarpon impressellum]|nr:MAG: hypothetical protein M1832_002727 [Thelocarpon impressellum]
MASRQQQLRRIVLTGSVAAITITGAWYGAGLKTQQEIKQQALIETPVSEKLAQLELRKRSLVARKVGLEQKIEELRINRRQQALEGGEKGAEEPH